MGEANGLTAFARQESHSLPRQRLPPLLQALCEIGRPILCLAYQWHIGLAVRAQMDLGNGARVCLGGPAYPECPIRLTGPKTSRRGRLPASVRAP